MHNTIRTACICLLTGAVLFVAYQVTLTLRSLQGAAKASETALQSIKASADQLPGVIQEVQGATQSLSDVVATERKAQTSQLRESQKVIAAVKEAVVRTDCQLNGGPGCVGVLPAAIGFLHTSQEGIQDTAHKASLMFQQSSLLLDSANQRLQDQRIDAILTSLDTSTLHFAATSEHVDGATKDLKDTADYYKKKLTTPAGFFRSLGNAALHVITVPLR